MEDQDSLAVGLLRLRLNARVANLLWSSINSTTVDGLTVARQKRVVFQRLE